MLWYMHPPPPISKQINKIKAFFLKKNKELCKFLGRGEAIKLSGLSNAFLHSQFWSSGVWNASREAKNPGVAWAGSFWVSENTPFLSFPASGGAFLGSWLLRMCLCSHFLCHAASSPSELFLPSVSRWCWDLNPRLPRYQASTLHCTASQPPLGGLFLEPAWNYPL